MLYRSRIACALDVLRIANRPVVVEYREHVHRFAQREFDLKNLQLIADKICIITASMRPHGRGPGN
jgi:hypothetical protein